MCFLAGSAEARVLKAPALGCVPSLHISTVPDGFAIKVHEHHGLVGCLRAGSAGSMRRTGSVSTEQESSKDFRPCLEPLDLLAKGKRGSTCEESAKNIEHQKMERAPTSPEWFIVILRPTTVARRGRTRCPVSLGGAAVRGRPTPGAECSRMCHPFFSTSSSSPVH